MRPGQNKRMRGRPNNNGGGGNRKGPNPLTRSYESNGPDVKIRGNAHHVAEKYLQLARDAQSSGDPVAAESYLQHAEHYFRLIASAQAAQAGFNRQPDATDTDGEDEDESGLPDRFASPQPATPFVPQPQAYAADRQPYSGGERQPYGQSNGNGERPAYGDRQNNGERPAYGDRNAYGQRQDRNGQDRNGQDRNGQDRNGLNRRPYRDNGAAGEIRTDDRGGDRTGQDRSQQDRTYQDRANQDRANQDRTGQDRTGQDRTGQGTYQDRQSRRERFAQERQERNGQSYDRQDRSAGDRYREGEQPRDPYAGEQPRVDMPADRQPDYGYQSESAPDAFAPQPSPAQPNAVQPSLAQPTASASTAQPGTASQPAARAEPTPRREARQERAAAVTEDAPGLPSFITTPTRVASVEPVTAQPEPSLASETAFPGDGAEEAPKFPRRRRRTTRASAEAKDAPGGELSELPVPTGD
ncbi:DUF4167 domain-containing protein [Lichenibacterium ramalinae]|uniref:DUF4167 domain-containing protein n=1 Tax=Lichenibacterium ramalinae TaxID=2316527 RepID=A0A4Q2RBU3_9HYPH|nr:DUF4167 domain-containing protein [Lichenibacterium ramalinae]